MSTEGFVLNSKDILPLILRNIQSKIHIISCKLVCKRWHACLKGPLKLLWKDLMEIGSVKEAKFIIQLLKPHKHPKIRKQEWKDLLLQKAVQYFNLSIVRRFLRTDNPNRFDSCEYYKTIILFAACRFDDWMLWVAENGFKDICGKTVRLFLEFFGHHDKLRRNWYELLYKYFDVDQEGIAKIIKYLREQNNKDGLNYFKDFKIAYYAYEAKQNKKLKIN